MEHASTSGVVLVNSFDGLVFDIALQPDGRIVMGGNLNSGDRVMLSRHLPSGAFDPTFGTGGIAHHSPPSFAITERGAAITLQPDGKIVVAGSIWRPNFFTTYRDAIEVKRYNANGTPDASFGSNGTAELFLINSDVWAADVAVDVAGNVVVVGGVDADHLRITRFTPQGGLDTTFGPGGSTTLDFSGLPATAAAIAQQADGRIIAAGAVSAEAGTQLDFALVRVFGGTVICTFALSATQSSVGPTNSFGTITVTGPAGCNWTAVSNASWVVVTAGAGSGNGVATYVYGANPSESARSATVTIAGQTFTLTQSAAAAPHIQVQPANVVVAAGSQFAQFTVTATANPPPTYQWQVSADAMTWVNVPAAAPYVGAASPILSITVGASTLGGNRYRVLVTNSAGAVTSNAALLTVRTLPLVVFDRTALRFGAVTNGGAFVAQTAAQVIRLMQSGNGTVTWTATPNQPWLRVSPASGTGSATLAVSVVASVGLPASGAVGASITFTFSGASNSPGPIIVTLTLVPLGTSTRPSGVVDTPADNRTGTTGAIPFTGWALDDLEVVRVMICRAAVPGEIAPVDPNCAGAAQIFVGFAVFIDGARPDVQAASPNQPLNSRGGWGFMVLTNMLPNQGNGTYRFFVYAQDREGNTTLLGTRTMTCANTSATLPFGAIDTPTQGGVAWGASFVNFGWALTPLPKMIPTDGSTIGVLIDGASIGTVNVQQPETGHSVAVSWTQQHERRDRVPGHRYDDADERVAHDLMDGR